MDGLVFQPLPAPRVSHPARADIACFAGFVARRSGSPLEAAERADLAARGWLGGPFARTEPEVEELLQIPVTVDSWNAFDRLFAWEARHLRSATSDLCATALGAAVRSFFAQGGRRCHVVRCGDPLPVDAGSSARSGLLEKLLPVIEPTPAAPDSWRGAAHLFGLHDTSILCLPDLPELFGVDTLARTQAEAPACEEHFVPFAATTTVSTPVPARLASIARCDAAGFARWAVFVRRIGALLALHAREVQFIAALPRPVDEATLGGDSRSTASAAIIRTARDAQWSEAYGIATCFVQLAYPWLRTTGSGDLPGGHEAPDGTLAGVLAHHSIARGSWHSAMRTRIQGIESVAPVLDSATIGRPLVREDSDSATVAEHLSLFGPSTTGFMLLTDVTSHRDAYRPANVNRLVSAIVRAARIVGEASVFDNSGEKLWRRLVDRFDHLLTGLWRDGVFAGSTPAEAFDVSCCLGKTMTQADVDNGRAIVRIAFTAASPIERIVIHLALDEGGHVSLLGKDAELEDA